MKANKFFPNNYVYSFNNGMNAVFNVYGVFWGL